MKAWRKYELTPAQLVVIALSWTEIALEECAKAARASSDLKNCMIVAVQKYFEVL